MVDKLTFFGLAPFVPAGGAKYLRGLYSDFKPFMFVCNGVGTSILPFRFGARAEIAILKI